MAEQPNISHHIASKSGGASCPLETSRSMSSGVRAATLGSGGRSDRAFPAKATELEVVRRRLETWGQLSLIATVNQV
jgi:hypothetical protein